MKIRKEDNVLVITGKDKGKKGKVRFVYPRRNRVLIEGVNMIKTHSRARQQVKQAGLIEREASIALSNVMLICTRCNKPARIGYKILDDGRKVRICRSCKEAID
ncbi:MAG: 50S ribosomal protein L24 [Chloroflexi bacterium RBG_13_46_9]|jgi:large subunit ribosomal protein L24|nr:MAG: 50S ribosomal protein L24 [Chloroflexi bacterium RBG_13_46_9]